jgi:hypothetical protein
MMTRTASELSGVTVRIQSAGHGVVLKEISA